MTQKNALSESKFHCLGMVFQFKKNSGFIPQNESLYHASLPDAVTNKCKYFQDKYFFKIIEKYALGSMVNVLLL